MGGLLFNDDDFASFSHDLSSFPDTLCRSLCTDLVLLTAGFFNFLESRADVLGNRAPRHFDRKRAATFL